MTMKGLLAVAVWFGIGYSISEQLEVGTVIEDNFFIIWIAVLLIGAVAWKSLDID